MAKKATKVKTERKEISFMGCKFYVKVNAGKFEKELARVQEIFSKGFENLTHDDRLELLKLYRPAFHDSGKIEGATSLDSTAGNCEFCKQIREANKDNPDCICLHCYDRKQEKRWIDVLNRHTLNMLIMMHVEFSIEELKTLTITQITRVNSSGDTPNQTYAENMIKIAYAFPWAKIGYWAKNVSAVIRACDKLGKPENLILVQSSYIIGFTAKKAKYFNYVFTVYKDEASTLEAIANGASECNGKKCDDCGWKCYLGTHESDNIAEVLR